MTRDRGLLTIIGFASVRFLIQAMAVRGLLVIYSMMGARSTMRLPAILKTIAAIRIPWMNYPARSKLTGFKRTELRQHFFCRAKNVKKNMVLFLRT
jgi:hypothetical protein